jgi:hypothetical protein
VQAHHRLEIDVLDRLMADEYKCIRADRMVAGKEADRASQETGDRYWEFAESDEYDV